MKVAVLVLQGAFIEHEQMLSRLGVSSFEIRQKKDLEQSFDGLIIPGGESTVQGKLLRELELFEPLRQRIEKGLPVFGTCAGLLLLAKKIENDERQHFATMDITAKRKRARRNEEASDRVNLCRMLFSFLLSMYMCSFICFLSNLQISSL